MYLFYFCLLVITFFDLSYMNIQLSIKLAFFKINNRSSDELYKKQKIFVTIVIFFINI